jgi:hypothetical protein
MKISGIPVHDNTSLVKSAFGSLPLARRGRQHDLFYRFFLARFRLREDL